MMLIHVMCAGINEINGWANEHNDNNLLIAPDRVGYYYQIHNNNNNFEIIHHTEQNPYSEKEDTRYIGPINLELFMQGFIKPTPLFIGEATDRPVELIIKTPSEKTLQKLDEIKDKAMANAEKKGDPNVFYRNAFNGTHH